MVKSDSIVVLSSEPATVAAVTAALRPKGQLRPENICVDLRGLATRLRTTPLEVVLVDLNGNPQKMFKELDVLVRQFHDTTFVILADNMQSDLLMEAMHVGARHFLTKDTIGTKLPGVIENINKLSEPVELGFLAMVLSACGGTGVTTLAINLAWEMQLLLNEPVLLVDLDPFVNTVCRYLEIEPRFGLLNLLRRSGSFDSALVQSNTVVYDQKLSLLGSGPDARMFNTFHYDQDRLGELISLCQSTYSAVVIDMPRVSQNMGIAMALRSEKVLLVFEASVNDIRALRTLITALVEAGVREEAICPVLNRHHKRGQVIPMKDIHDALGGREIITLSNDYLNTIKAVNLGKPLAQTAGRCELRQDIQKLAQTLIGHKVKA